MNASFDFSGKTILVTGGASGIGLGTVQAFARNRATVVIADISDDQGEAAVREIVEQGGKAEFAHLDVTSVSQVDEVIAAIVGRHGKLDFAFNNAGIGGAFGPLANTDHGEWQRVVEVDLMSVYYCMHAEIRAMRQSGGGAIVNMASAAGISGAYGSTAYVASKHGVVGLTRGAAMDYAAQGIRINAVCPGLIATPLLAMLPQATLDRLTEAAPIRRPGTTDEIAQAVMWLCSDGASYMIGHALPVDGGVTLGGTATRMDG